MTDYANMDSKPRILVVDDDEMTRLMVREVLGNNNFEIVDAKNGLQGLELIASTQPDLVLLDVMMPEMDGFGFLRQLGDEHSSHAPIVMMTAVEDVHCVEHAFALGASDFISKPIQWMLLPYRIRSVLRKRRAEETLRIANEEQRAIFDAATSGVVLVKDRHIMHCNRKLEEIFYYDKGELDGQPTRIWFPDEAAYDLIGEEVANGSFHRHEQQLVRKDGSFFWARLSGQVLDETDPSKGIVGIVDDITVEHEAAKSLLEAKELAEEATKIISEFLANMSHEIRTPMNGVLGMLDLLRDTPMSATQQDWLETAHSSAHTLLDIINDILDFSKLEAGKFEVELVDFNLVDLVDDICALLAGRAFAAGLELNCALPVPMPPQWRGDPMRIRQVLTNLVGNAVKFTEQGE
ncbi:MAG: response regulator, partial [Methylococcales bacterium]|nr:response regulator [Methylococcales bacterium]